MKKLILSIVCLILINTSVLAVSYNSDLKIFVNELVNDALKTLKDKSLSQTKKAEFIEKIALNNVDIKALGLYTLGDIRKNLSTDILNNYNILFEKYFLKSLTSRLTEYSENKFEVIGSDQKSSSYTMVQSKIIGSQSQPEIKIDWRIYTKDPMKPLIRDLIVEGLSLARTQKEEFSSILNSNNQDINVLFEKIKEFIKK